MNLIEQIKEDAINSSVPLTDTLRRCAQLARNLGNNELRDWVDHELNGYPGWIALPEYRILSASASGHFAGIAGSELRNFSIPASILPEEHRDFGNRVFIRQPIAECISLAESDSSSGVTSPWPGELIALVGTQILEGMQCYAAWQKVSSGAFVGLVDAVRNRLHKFLLELELEVPEAGDQEIPLTPEAKQNVTQLFQTIIHGNVENIATGSPGTVQVSATVIQGDFISLQKYLTTIGVPISDIGELEKALEADAEHSGLGPQTTEWLAKVRNKAKSGAIKVGSGILIGLIVDAIMKYLGIG